MDETEIRRLLDERQYRGAFELIVQQLQDRIFRLAFSMIRDQAQAQDLAQEASRRAFWPLG